MNETKPTAHGAPAADQVKDPVCGMSVDPAKTFCVGFAAESQDLAKHAREKLERKRVPLIVGNLGPATFGRDDNALLLVDSQGERELPHNDKLSLARELLRDVAERIAKARTTA